MLNDAKSDENSITPLNDSIFGFSSDGSWWQMEVDKGANQMTYSLSNWEHMLRATYTFRASFVFKKDVENVKTMIEEHFREIISLAYDEDKGSPLNIISTLNISYFIKKKTMTQGINLFIK